MALFAEYAKKEKNPIFFSLIPLLGSENFQFSSPPPFLLRASANAYARLVGELSECMKLVPIGFRTIAP